MSKEELQKIESSFNEKVDNEKDSTKLAALFERFYNYLLEQIEQENDKETKAMLVNTFYQLIYKIATTFASNEIKLKEIATNWNSYLVSRTYSSKSKNSEELSQLLDDIKREKDFATKAYCYQVLQQDRIVDFSKMLITEKQLRTVQRPGFNGTTVPDDGSKYWHLDAKELMTYDECTERGLGHHLLYYPVGHEWQNMSVGFMETDPSKVQKNFGKETDKFIETVFVSEETLI